MKQQTPKSIRNIWLSLTAIFLAFMVELTMAGEMTEFRDQCLACTSYGFNYCLNDPNLVNLNQDRCYEFKTDKAQYCPDFDFIANSMLCDTYNLTDSTSCDDLFSSENMKFNKPWRGEISLKPRSSCGFFLYQYSAFLDITW